MSACSLSYEKIAQKSDMSKKKDFFLLRCMSECSLSYEKIVQKSDMSKKKDMIFLLRIIWR